MNQQHPEGWKTRTVVMAFGKWYNVDIEVDEDGWYIPRVPSLPGCISQGKTYNEARKSIAEAIECYLESEMKRQYEIMDREEDDNKEAK